MDKSTAPRTGWFPYATRAPGEPTGLRRAHRDTERPVIGGVAAGLADHLGCPVVWVRVAFIVLATLGGFGLALYAALWIFLPAAPIVDASAPGLASAARTGRRPGRARRLADAGPAIALGALAVGVLLTVQGALGLGYVIWPVGIALAGLALLWRQADEAQRARWEDLGGRDGPLRAVFGRGGVAAYARVLVGGALLFGALFMFSWRSGGGSVARDVAVAVLLGIVGLALVVGPWVLRLWADLDSERAERVRSQERADMAAHLHDSVLQTLALIQKNAQDPAMVARLARAQERDLRSWLFEEPADAQTSLAGAVKQAAARVEDEYGIQVDVVVVGDAPLDAALRPLAQATSEAVVNAAKHSGTERVDVYAEVSRTLVEVFVRDRGVGFDPDAVAEDRQGMRSSIIGRMERHGGSARVRSAPGEGTEVRLEMPRASNEEESR